MVAKKLSINVGWEFEDIELTIELAGACGRLVRHAEPCDEYEELLMFELWFPREVCVGISSGSFEHK